MNRHLIQKRSQSLRQIILTDGEKNGDRCSESDHRADGITDSETLPEVFRRIFHGTLPSQYNIVQTKPTVLIIIIGRNGSFGIVSCAFALLLGVLTILYILFLDTRKLVVASLTQGLYDVVQRHICCSRYRANPG